MLDAQREHWQATFDVNPDMYGTGPSEPGAYAAGLFAREQVRDLLELGAGQGRDTLAFLRAGLTVTAIDYAAGALASLHRVAAGGGLANRLTTVVHDLREPLPLPDSGFDAVYSHMLFNMALTTAELETLSREVHRALRPAGLHVYAVRHTGDAHYGAGTSHGDSMFRTAGSSSTFSTAPSSSGSPPGSPCSASPPSRKAACPDARSAGLTGRRRAGFARC